VQDTEESGGQDAKTCIEGVYRLLWSGDEAFHAMIEAMDAARSTIVLETYTFAACKLGEKIRDALTRACNRGVRVRVLLDSFGSLTLTDVFWWPVRNAGGQVRWFNPFSLKRFGFRNHRKLLICDNESAFIGGFNIAPEYEGDGINKGWRDAGLKLSEPIVQELAASFDLLFENAEFRHLRFTRLRKSPLLAQANQEKPFCGQRTQLLLSGPGRGSQSLKITLRKDLLQSRQVNIIAAYFLPTWRIRRTLLRIARRGGKVQLLLAGKSDVFLSQYASRVLYQRMLKAGIEVYEYQPQILHAKMIVLDDIVYLGSANMDVRSLNINYELVLKLHQPALAAEARALFAEALAHSRRIDATTWPSSRGFIEKMKEYWAYLILTRLDPYIARLQMRHLR